MDVPGIQTMLGSAGACPEIEFEGHLFKIGHPTQRTKAALEELTVGKAVAEIRRLKACLPPDAYVESFAALNSSIAAGDYRTWAPGWQRIVLSGQNAHLFLLALLRENHPNAKEDLALALSIAEPEQVGAALARVVPDFFAMILDDLPLQKEQREKANEALSQVTQNFLVPLVQQGTDLKPKSPKSTSPPPAPSTPTSGGYSSTSTSGSASTPGGPATGSPAT